MLREFYSQFYLAITDFSFYRVLIEQPARKTLLFLLFLSAHLAIFLTFYYGWVLGPRVSDFFDWAGENFPSFTVEDGQLTIEAEQPLVRKYEGGTTWTFVFDTTGTYTSLIGFEEPALLLTRDQLLLRLGGQTQTYPWRELGPFQFSAEKVKGYEEGLRRYYIPVAYGIFLIVSLVAKGVLAALLTPICLSVASRNGVRLPFSSCYGITLYSLAPAIIIDSAVKLTGLEIYYFDLIYLSIAALYTYMATQKSTRID